MTVNQSFGFMIKISGRQEIDVDENEGREEVIIEEEEI